MILWPVLIFIFLLIFNPFWYSFLKNRFWVRYLKYSSNEKKFHNQNMFSTKIVITIFAKNYKNFQLIQTNSINLFYFE